MTRAVIYARVSSEEQAGPEKSSIQTQLADCRALAAQLGWSVVGEFVDDRKYRSGRRIVEPSGTRPDRPQWQQLLATLRNGKADALLAWHSSRLWRAYRPMVDALEIIEANHIDVRLVKDSFDVRFAPLQAWLGKEENDARSERVRFGLAGRARRGLPPSVSRMLFFRPVIEPASGERLGYEFVERFRPIMAEMARLFLAGYPYHAIARELGPNPGTGKRWSRSTVQQIIGNPLYKGVLEYGKTRGAARFTVPAPQFAVWDADTCRAIDAELARRKRLGSPRSLLPFSGILHCGYCGRQMAGQTVRRVGQPFGRPYRVYVCAWRFRAVTGDVDESPHPPNSVTEHKLVTLLLKELEALRGMSIDDALAVLESLAPPKPADNQASADALADLQRQIADIEPDLAHVRTPAARAALESELGRLRQEADLHRVTIERAQPAPMIDTARLRQAWVEMLAEPNPFELPDLELRARLSALFSVLYYASGQFGRYA